MNIDLPPWLNDINKDKHLIKLINLRDAYSSKKFKMLLSDRIELESMWITLKRRENHNSNLYFLRFRHDVQLSLVRSKFSRFSNKNRKMYASKISNKAEELSALLKESDFDDGIFNVMNDKDVFRLTGERDADELRLLQVSSFLIQLSEDAKLKGERTDTIQTSNSKNEEQTYYIRSLTKRMRERFNTPLRNVVAVSASVIFDNPVIDVPYVAKYAP